MSAIAALSGAVVLCSTGLALWRLLRVSSRG